MGFESKALEGFYTKCGVPLHEAEIISSMFGNNYILEQSIYRQQGFGSNSKAAAAVGIAESVFKSDPEEIGSIWSDASSKGDLDRTLKIIRASGICYLGTVGYAFQEDHVEKVSMYFEGALSIAKDIARDTGSDIDINAYADEFSNTASRQTIASLALGGRKGFFSKLLG